MNAKLNKKTFIVSFIFCVFLSFYIFKRLIFIHNFKFQEYVNDFTVYLLLSYSSFIIIVINHKAYLL